MLRVHHRCVVWCLQASHGDSVEQRRLFKQLRTLLDGKSRILIEQQQQQLAEQQVLAHVPFIAAELRWSVFAPCAELI